MGDRLKLVVHRHFLIVGDILHYQDHIVLHIWSDAARVWECTGWRNKVQVTFISVYP